MHNWELTARIEYRINAQDLLLDVLLGTGNASPWRTPPPNSWRIKSWAGRSGSSSSTRKRGCSTRPCWQRSARASCRFDVEFRCDAPHLCRHIRLTMLPLSKDRVQFVGTVLKGRAAGFNRPSRSGLSDALTICSRYAVGANRCWLPDGRYAKVEEAVDNLGLSQRDVQPALSHGICPTCLSKYSSIVN